MTPPEAYERWRAGEISPEQASKLIPEAWEDVEQLARVEDILANQPTPVRESNTLFR